MQNEVKSFIGKYVGELSENNVAIFAGAGMSVPAGYVNWKGLLRPLADDLGVDIDGEYDLISLAQYHCNENGRHGINQQLLNEIASNKNITKNHKVLSRLPIRTYWTTNYDKLIERALEENGKIVDVKYTINQLSSTTPNRDAIVYKMHGDIDHPDSAIVTKDDYERYASNYGPYINALSGDLVSKTFLFIGFSFTDPNLDYIMSRIRITFKEHQRQHFCIFRRVAKSDYQDTAAYEQAEKKQQLVITDLKRFQIKAILVDQYSQITEILEKIEKLYKRKTLFISGSADYYSPWNRLEIEGFLCKLSRVLIEKNFKIVSGVGLGVGNAVITGAVDAIYSHHNGRINDYLHMRPLPQLITDPEERRTVWKKYRYELIGNAGIALFFMGNRLADGQAVLADGVKEEFQIAHELGLAVIPIGATGYMANELWKEVTENISRYYPGNRPDVLEKIKLLGEPVHSPDQLIPKIIDVINTVYEE